MTEKWFWSKTEEVFELLGEIGGFRVLKTPHSEYPWLLKESSIVNMELLRLTEQQYEEKLNIKFSDYDIVNKARNLAIKWCVETNHKYGDVPVDIPYTYHLHRVYYYALKYIHLIPEELRPYVLAAAFVHDSIEDQRVTKNDIIEELGEKVSDIAYALTNLRGKNRKERASDEYYTYMQSVEGAVYLKICDRLANVEYSIETKKMLKKYQQELPDFKKALRKSVFSDLIVDINKKIQNHTYTQQYEITSQLRSVKIDLENKSNDNNDMYKNMWSELETMLA